MSCVANDFKGLVVEGCVDRRLSSCPAIGEVKVDMGDIDMLKLFETAFDSPLTSTAISRGCEAIVASQIFARTCEVVSFFCTIAVRKHDLKIPLTSILT